MKDDLLYVDHVLETSEAISGYMHGVSLEAFGENSMLYDAVVRNLQIMAESTQKISKEIKDRYKNVSWAELSGFRNILVHDYLEGINPEIVWKAAVYKLPELREAFLIIKDELER